MLLKPGGHARVNIKGELVLYRIYLYPGYKQSVTMVLK